MTDIDSSNIIMLLTKAAKRCRMNEPIKPVRVIKLWVNDLLHLALFVSRFDQSVMRLGRSTRNAGRQRVSWYPRYPPPLLLPPPTTPNPMLSIIVFIFSFPILDYACATRIEWMAGWTGLGAASVGGPSDG